MFEVSPSARPAPVDRPILSVLADRWSARAIDPARPVSPDLLLTMLEAARWAPSNGNAQPWRYLVFDDRVPEALAEARDCLNRGNDWARRAPVLLLSVVVHTWPDGDELNRMALHDVGAASLSLVLQGVAEGLVVHQMAGFDVERARSSFSVPRHVDPVAMIAVGYPGSVADLPEGKREREYRPRRRRPIDETAFLGGFTGPGLARVGSVPEP